MMITPSLLLLTVAVVLIDCRPQENFYFPGNSARPSRFAQRPPIQSPRFSLQTPSQPFSPGNQPFPTQNQTMPARITPAQPNQPQATSLAPTSSDGTTARTPRVPPRDPTNRIIYIIPNNCNCPFTTQYSPVCGTNGQTYGNVAILNCNNMCGSDVEVYLMGACGSNNG